MPLSHFGCINIILKKRRIERRPFEKLGTGHKVTARVGWSNLGWAMENLWAVSMGRQFFCRSTVGPPNKNPCMLIIYYIKILIMKVNKTIQIIKCKWCYWSQTSQYFVLYNNKKWSNHSKYNQLESSSLS
jgi:hypothetical protein